LGAFAVSGSYAVFIFFCISGYLMAKILDRDYGPGSLSRFYWNRAARILPVYYLAVVFTAAVLPYAISLHDWQVLLFLNNYFPARFPNAPLWSLATEVQFYILAPAVAWATRRWRATPLVLLAVGAGVKLSYWFGFELLPLPAQNVVYMGLEANLIYFMTGWSAYTYRDRLPTMGAATGIALIGVALAGMWLFHFYFMENTVLGLYRSPAWMLAFPLLMCVVALITLPGLDDGGHAMKRVSVYAYALYFLGVTSYSAYVLHMAVFNVIRLPVLLELAAVYALAGVVFLGFERPLFRLRAFPQARPSQHRSELNGLGPARPTQPAVDEGMKG
jgi:peptidoglycan/LPS O-acetylase OafA/YrhL